MTECPDGDAHGLQQVVITVDPKGMLTVQIDMPGHPSRIFNAIDCQYVPVGQIPKRGVAVRVIHDPAQPAPATTYYVSLNALRVDVFPANALRHVRPYVTSVDPAPLSPRSDGLVVGQPFYAVLVYDRTGFFGAVTGRTVQEAKERAARRSVNKSLVACSVPFAGSWRRGMPDVGLPDDFKAELAAIEKTPDHGDTGRL